MASGDTQCRHFTAMDEYYQNGPLPTWIGWYAQHLPHSFHVATAFATLALELVLVWMLFFPRRVRIICLLIVTPWQIAVISTANSTFLNFLVLALAVFLLDDRFLARFAPKSWRSQLPQPTHTVSEEAPSQESAMPKWQQTWASHVATVKVDLTAIMVAWLFYSTTDLLICIIWLEWPLASALGSALPPLRTAHLHDPS